MDAFDRDKYKGVIEFSPILQKMQAKGKEAFPSFASLQRDLWAGLYKYDPSLKKYTPPELRMNHEILKYVYAMPEFQGLREITRFDNLASAVGLLSVEEKVQNVIGDCLFRNKEKQESLNKAVKDAENSKLKEEILKKRLDELKEQLKQKQQQQRNENSPSEQQQGEQTSLEQQQNPGQTHDQEQQNQNKLQSKGDSVEHNQLQQMIEQLEQSMNAQQNKSQQASQEAESIANQLASDINQSMKNSSSNLSAAIGNAMEETQKDTKIIRLLTQKGGAGQGNSHGQKSESDNDVAVSLELARQLKNNVQIKRVTEIAGRMKKIAFSKKKEKVLSMAKQRVETGNDIDRLVPNELLLFNTPDTHQYFLKRYSESQCIQYSKKAKDKAGKGPVICCIDVSGSMQSTLDTISRAEWAKGVAFALYSIAMRDKRPFHLIEFDAYVIDNYQIKKSETEKIVRLLTPRSLGGTDFYKPLQEAFKIISSKNEFKKADIIFITDGDANLSGTDIKWISEQKKAKKTSILSIQLDKSGYRNTLEHFSDMVIKYDGSDKFTRVFEI